MIDEHTKLLNLQQHFRRLYDHPNFARSGGIFRTTKRKQLLGLKGKSGRNSTKADFRYKTRKSIETALIDLQLFILTSEYKDVSKVINFKTLRPVIKALVEPEEPVDFIKQEPEKAKVALLLIESGFQYLKETTANLMTSSQERMINDSVDLSKQLTALLLPENERIELLTDGCLW